MTPRPGTVQTASGAKTCRSRNPSLLANASKMCRTSASLAARLVTFAPVDWTERPRKRPPSGVLRATDLREQIRGLCGQLEPQPRPRVSSHRAIRPSTWRRCTSENENPASSLRTSAGSSLATAASRCSRCGVGCRSCRRSQRNRLTLAWSVMTVRSAAYRALLPTGGRALQGSPQAQDAGL